MSENPKATLNVPVFEENPLCSKQLPTNATQGFARTCEKSDKIRLEDWLNQSGYPEDGEKLARCSLTVGHYKCIGDHDFYYRQYCGREYCPICGQKDSYYHHRRTLRAAVHFIWAIPWGNLTFTIPKDISESYLSKRYLSILQKAVWEVARDNFGVEGVEVVIHPLGQAEGGLHIHFEVLFMIVGTFGKAMVPPVVIENTKKAWALKLNEIFNLKLTTADVRYSFVTKKSKKWHKMNYIHRPICTEDAMLKLSDQDKKYILSLKGFRRIRYFGCMADRKIRQWLRKHWAPIKIRDFPMIERKVCAICKQKMRYIGFEWVNNIPTSQVVKYNDNIWIDKVVDAFLREQHNKEEPSDS